MARDPGHLDVIRLAHTLALEVYLLTEALPDGERFGLQTQLRRAAVSIPTNIVEGCARTSPRDYARFIDIALGSAAELRYLLDLSVDLGFISSDAAASCKKSSDVAVRSLTNLQRAVSRFSRRTPTVAGA
jgi:four helix bundle protein